MKRESKASAKLKDKNDQAPIVMEPEVAYGPRPSNSSISFSSGIPSISSFLGKSKNGSKDADDTLNKHQYISIIREGVKMQTLEHLMKATDISSNEMASIMHTSERTLRRYTSDTVLNPEQSERIIELARLFTRGSEVFGSLDNFKSWMNSTIIAFGNKKPKELLDTSLGIEILQEELGRIEHGIFA